MEVKNLLDPATKQEIISRINRLSATSQPLWGKMNVAQMLAHCQRPLGVAIGKHKLKGNFLIRLIGPMMKGMMYSKKPFSKNLPTDKSFIVTTDMDFEKEKAALVSMINEFTESNMSGEPHPFFGKLSPKEWSMGLWKHTDHHLQQFGV